MKTASFMYLHAAFMRAVAHPFDRQSSDNGSEGIGRRLGTTASLVWNMQTICRHLERMGRWCYAVLGATLSLS